MSLLEFYYILTLMGINEFIEISEGNEKKNIATWRTIQLGEIKFIFSDKLNKKINIEGKIPYKIKHLLNEFGVAIEGLEIIDEIKETAKIQAKILSSSPMHYETLLNELIKSNPTSDDNKFITKIKFTTLKDLIKFLLITNSYLTNTELEADLLDEKTKELKTKVYIELLNNVQAGLTIEDYLKELTTAFTYCRQLNKDLMFNNSGIIALNNEASKRITVSKLKHHLTLFENAINPFISSSQEQIENLISKTTIRVNKRLSEYFLNHPLMHIEIEWFGNQSENNIVLNRSSFANPFLYSLKTSSSSETSDDNMCISYTQNNIFVYTPNLNNNCGIFINFEELEQFSDEIINQVITVLKQATSFLKESMQEPDPKKREKVISFNNKGTPKKE